MFFSVVFFNSERHTSEWSSQAENGARLSEIADAVSLLFRRSKNKAHEKYASRNKHSIKIAFLNLTIRNELDLVLV